MARTTVPLTRDLLDQIEAPCRSCVFWELDPVRRQRLDREGAAHEKDAWVSEVLREWGSCGRVLMIDGAPRGYIIYAPPAYVPGVAAFPTAPVSPDAVVLTTAWVDPSYDGVGLGRLLVQGMARDLVSRSDEGVRAVEAFARTGRDRGRTSCALPADFLARVGFKTHRAHPTSPRMRMDLRAAITWRDELGAAWEKLRGVVRPAPAKTPTPAHRER
ncbi:MAG: GNAT family N-acetyltransferase [Nocardioidaceae bacterium]|nr:GNAT family N-acetyltransferase [Nocardioidaceae bacterium]MCL2612765.1 GNAT family N-acetyltransferase [Nocardioidaceae bacterium]